MKSILYSLLLLISLFIMACNIGGWPTETSSENWIAMIDVDGNNLQFICKGYGKPFFVPDPENLQEEIILISIYPSIDLMNLDGSNRRTIIDSIGSVYCLSEDRRKMLIVGDGEIYLANSDGTGLQNLTNTPDILEEEPSFSIDGEKVIYRSKHDNESIIAIEGIDLISDSTFTIYEENISGISYFVSPTYISNSSLMFGQYYSSLDSLNTEGLYHYNGIYKELIDQGYINSKLSYNKNVDLLAYRNANKLKFFQPETNTIVEIYETYNRNIPPVFSDDGRLISVSKYIYDTNTLEKYNVLEGYEDIAKKHEGSIDFNKTTTQVIMNLDRVLPYNTRGGGI